MQRKTIFFFCYRMMEFKLFVNAEILNEITKTARLVIFVPEDFCEDCEAICPDGVVIRAIRHPSFKLGTNSQPTLATRLEAFLRNIFRLHTQIMAVECRAIPKTTNTSISGG